VVWLRLHHFLLLLKYFCKEIEMNEVQMGSAGGENTRDPSPKIWNDCPVEEFAEVPGKGVHIFEDFRNALVGKETASGTDFTSGVGRIDGVIPWYAYAESDKLVDLALQADGDGVVMLDLDGTDADVDCIVSGDNVVGSFKTPTIGETKGFWFEARVKFSTVTDDDAGSFIGLSQPGEAKDAGGVMAAGGLTLQDIDYLGFARLSDDGDKLNVVYNEAASGVAQTSTELIALTVDTYISIGFKLVSTGVVTKIRFYADGVDLGDDVAITVSSTNANFPSATLMAATLSWIAESGVANGHNMKIDWVKIAQQY
jgi:hypothetical protein